MVHRSQSLNIKYVHINVNVKFCTLTYFTLSS